MSGSSRSSWTWPLWPSRSFSPSKSEQSPGSSRFSQDIKKPIKDYGQRVKAKMGLARRGITKAASKAKNMREHLHGREKALRKQMGRYINQHKSKTE